MLLLPIRTDRPRIRPAYLTILLIVVCTLVHAAGFLAPEVPVRGAVGPSGEPVVGPLLVVEYGLWGSRPTLLTFLTHMFIHGDLLHLAGNMLFLWIFGSLIEDALRPWGMAALYLGGGFFAALAHIGISAALGQDVDVPMVGASGAVAAIMGLFMLRFYRTRVQIFYLFRFRGGTFWVQSVWALVIWIALEVLGGVLDANMSSGGGGVAHWAHVGGFVAGAIAAPFVGGIAAARKEYITDDPETNVEYLRRGEVSAAAEKALRADPGNPYLMRRLAQSYRRAGEHALASDMYQQCVTRFAARGLAEQAAEVYRELLAYNDAAVLPPEVRLRVAQQLETVHPAEAAHAYHAIVMQHVARPEAEYALLRLAVLYARCLSRPYEALSCVNQFLQRYPSSRWAAQAREQREQLDRELRLR